MVITLNTNISTMQAQRSLWNANMNAGNIINKLSTGIRINSASDDAANLSLSKKINSSQKGVLVANNNIEIGLSRLQTYDGYISGMIDSLHRMRDLTVQSANGVYNESERGMLDLEAQELMKELAQASQNANRDVVNKAGDGFVDGSKKITEAEAISAGYTENQIIRTAQDFVNKVTGHEGDNFILVTDLDMSEVNTSFNSSVISNAFTGTMNGNGHVIKNLVIDSAGNNIGLFSNISNTGEVKNLGLENINISGGNNTAGLAGNNSGLIENCYTSGSVSGSNASGIIAGQNFGQISKCTSSGSIFSFACAGGLVGTNIGQINNSSSSSSVKANDVSGGLVGNGAGMNSIENCFATGNVSGNTNIGGLAGNYSGNISNCYATGSVTGMQNVGGLAGLTGGASISGAYSTGDINGQQFVGGLVGMLSGGSFLSESYASNFTEGEMFVGGLYGGLTGGNVDSSCFWNTDQTSETGQFMAGVMNGQGLTTEEISKQALSTLGEDWTSNGVIAHQKAFDKELSLQIGAKAEDSSYLTFDNINLNMNFSIDLNNANNSRASMQMVDEALDYLTSERATVGSRMNILNNMISRNSNTSNNLAESNSIILDTDYSIESANLARNQILAQSSTSILQQAENFSSGIILSLLQ